MKTTAKHVLTLLLAFALVFELGVTARAADATGVTLQNAALTIREGQEKPIVTLTADIAPSSYTGGVTWSIVNGDSVVEIVGTTATTVTLRAKAAGTATIEASSAGESPVSGRCTVTATNDRISSHAFDSPSYSLGIGGSLYASLITTFASGETVRTTNFTVDNPSVVTVDSSGRLTGKANGTTTLRAKYNGTEVKSIEVKVRTLQSLSLSPGTLSLDVGKSQVLTAAVSPGSITDYSYTLTSSNANVASVDTSTRRVTGIAPGSATITLTADGRTATCRVTVIQTSNDVTVNAAAGTGLTLGDVEKTLANRFYSEYGVSESRAMIALNSLGSAGYGTLYRSEALYRSGNSSAVVETGYTGSLSTVGDMYFVPAAAGDYVLSYTMYDPYGFSRLSGTVTICVSTQTRNIRIGVGETGNYSFSEASRSGSTGARIIADTLGGFSTLTFGAVRSGGNVGTLYTNALQSYASLVESGTKVGSDALGDLYFVPNRAGTYEIAYTANSGLGNGVISSGVLSIVVGSDSLDAVVTLDDLSPYRFNSTTIANGETAEQILRRAINGSAGSSFWNYIRFDEVSAASAQVGKLYVSSAVSDPINSNTYINYSDIGSLYFVPGRIGTYEIGYSVYSDNSASSLLTSGTLKLVTSNVPRGSADLQYSTITGGSVTFSEEDFVRFFRSKRGARYQLAYVVFDSYASNYGTFSHNGSPFVPYNSADYYTDSYTGSTFGSARYLKNVRFTAPATAGYQAIRFTCYGGTNSSLSNVQQSGVLYLFATEAAVPSVTYYLGNMTAQTLQESDFASAYKTALNPSGNVPSFYIQLLDVPGRGTLYYNYTNSSRTGTRITDSNRSNYRLYVNGGSAQNSVSKLTYIPSGSSDGTATAHYLAYASDGTELYAGAISFRYGAQKTASVSAEGKTFEPGDVYSASSSDPVHYLVFARPESGGLYLNYGNGRGTALPDNTKLYTISSANGSYPLSALTYIPRAGASGTVTLRYTAYTRSGDSYDDAISVSVQSKTRSDIFSDVTPSDVGTWAANAIDFANTWGLVKGVSATPPYRYAPRDTMRRCDLVLILYRIAGSPSVSGTAPYSDIPSDAYYYDSALWAYRNGIVTDVASATLYGPATNVTREEFAKLLYNLTAALGMSTANSGTLGGYTDAAQVSAYARSAMQWAVAKGYITSTSTSQLVLSPASTATRAEIATLLHRYLTY